MWRSVSIQFTEDDDVVASTDQPGYVSVQVHDARFGGYVTLMFGVAGEVEGLVVIDKLMTALGECRAHLAAAAADKADPAIRVHAVELGERAKGSGR